MRFFVNEKSLAVRQGSFSWPTMLRFDLYTFDLAGTDVESNLLHYVFHGQATSSHMPRLQSVTSEALPEIASTFLHAALA